MDNITELNALIYAEAKLACDKISEPLRNPNRNTKPRREIKLEGQVKNTSSEVTKGNRLEGKDQNKTADKYSNTT